jgi:peptidylamidoglycolate lyase
MTMKKVFRLAGMVECAVLALCAVTSTATFAQAAERGGMDETGPYQVVENWFKPGVDRWNQVITSVAVDTSNRIIVASGDEHLAQPGSLILSADGVPLNLRRDAKVPDKPDSERTHLHQILVLNADGKVMEDWQQWNDLIVVPHNVAISPYDRERHIWVIDREGQQILKFTNDGKKLVLKIGEKGVAGTDHEHFNLPAGIAFLPDGSFYIADGYRNTRVIKFDAAGKFQLEWGTKGTEPGQFNLVHSVAVDAARRVFVADRSNNRIQIFDAQGKFLDQWQHIAQPAYLLIAADNKSLWVASNGADRIAKYDMNGVFQTSWGVHGNLPGWITNFHNFAVDPSGALYVADAFNNRVQKFVPRAGADQRRLVDQPLVLK